MHQSEGGGGGGQGRGGGGGREGGSGSLPPLGDASVEGEAALAHRGYWVDTDFGAF